MGFTSFDGSKNVEIVTEFPNNVAISVTIIVNKIVGRCMRKQQRGE